MTTPTSEPVPQIGWYLGRGVLAPSEITAAQQGDLEAVRVFLGTLVDDGPSRMRAGTFLLIAAEAGQSEVCRVLITEGKINVNAFSLGHQVSGLMLACRNRHEDTIGVLLELGAGVRLAVSEGDVETVGAAIRHGFDVNAFEGGLPLLHRAVDARKPVVVQALLAAGAEVDAPDQNGETSLMKALEMNRPEEVRLLLAAGADGMAVAPHRTPQVSCADLAHPGSEAEAILRAWRDQIDLKRAVAAPDAHGSTGSTPDDTVPRLGSGPIRRM